MGKFYGVNEKNSKSVADDQTLEWVKQGDRKPWFDKTVIFYGSHWVDLFKMLANAGIGQHCAIYFIGARVDPQKKTIAMRGAFSSNYFRGKYGGLFKDWAIKTSGKRVALPSAGDNDGLQFIIDGRHAADFWADHFASVGDDVEIEG